ncbi:hypothetical protein [Achromobacter sp. 413638]|uniref:hypothetical protein n=1 Tax=Achromobacter sp. 413638 TaxID=3342385 RepID=UPI00370BB928
MAEAGNRMTRALIGLIVAAGIGWYFWGGGLDRQAANNVQKIHDKVAQDAVEQYQIAAQSGEKRDVCLQARLVAAAYLQAKNESKYKQWKVTEQADCSMN